MSSIPTDFNNYSLELFNPLAGDSQYQDSDHLDLPLLVYLPGMDGTGKLFGDQARNLAPYFKLRCLKIPSNDLRDWQDLTKATVNCLLRELNNLQQEKIYLCGESFGGCLAMSVALTIPNVVHKLVVINSASSFNQQPILGLGINLIPLLPGWLHRNSALGMLPFLAELNRINSVNRRALLAAMKSLPQKVVSWRLAMLRDFALDSNLCQQFIQETLIIASKGDRLLPSVREADKLANLFPNTKIEILPDSGHACLLETKINLAEILLKYDLIGQKLA